jgi:hypothetical protein
MSTNTKYFVDTSYDFIDNGSGELMMVMDMPENSVLDADDDNAKVIFNGTNIGMLIRNAHEHIRMPVIPKAVGELLLKLHEQSQIMLVTEMDGEDIHDVYEATIIIDESFEFGEIPKFSTLSDRMHDHALGIVSQISPDTDKKMKELLKKIKK